MSIPIYDLRIDSPTLEMAGRNGRETSTMILYHTYERERRMIYEICMSAGGICNLADYRSSSFGLFCSNLILITMPLAVQLIQSASVVDSRLRFCVGLESHRWPQTTEFNLSRNSGPLMCEFTRHHFGLSSQG